MPKSELSSVGAAHITFSSDGSVFGLEKNVGQPSFANSPNSKHDLLRVQIDNEEWFVLRRDAKKLHEWLSEALQ